MADPSARGTREIGHPVTGTFRPLAPVRKLSEHPRVAWFLLLPSLLVIAAVSVGPTVYGIALSVREMQLTQPELGTGFVGLAHYRTMIADEIFWIAVRNTVLWVVLAMVIELGLGLISALALNQGVRGTGTLGLLIILPWFVPTVVAANAWALMLDPRLGVINDLLVQSGLLAQPLAWFAEPVTAFLSAVVVEAWHGFPFFTLLLLAGLKGIPGELYEAAAIDGAIRTQRFWHITVPMLRMVIAATVCLRMIGLVNSPDLLLVLTGGGPGHTTEVLALYAFNTAYRQFDFGYAGALSVVMLGLQMALCYAYVRYSGALRTM